MVDSSIYSIAVRKITGGIISRNEEDMLLTWLKVKDNQKEYDELEKVWKSTAKVNYSLNSDTELAWKQFKNQRNTLARKRNRRIIQAVSGIAASIVILISILLVIPQNDQVAYQTQDNIQQVKLPDNSTVQLNKFSQLTFNNQFGKENRNVFLSGEAFFEVSENPELPFEISAENNISAKVLGTVFNLRAYSNENLVELMVVKGRVNFAGSEGNGVVTEAGERAVYNVNQQQLLKKKPLNENLMAWQSGLFEFNNVLVTEIVEPFERYFNKEIVLPQNVDNIHYTGKFKQPTQQSFAKVIGLALGWQYTITTEKIIFTKK